MKVKKIIKVEIQMQTVIDKDGNRAGNRDRNKNRDKYIEIQLTVLYQIYC